MSKQTNSYGVGFFGLLAILFVGLKLGEVGVVATWPWWWVLSPLWLPWVVVIAVATLIYAVRELWRVVR